MVDSEIFSWLRAEILIFGLAALGGVVVLIGLWMEYVSVKDKYENINDFRHSKLKERCGEKVVMVGIIIEIVVAIVFAWRGDWEIKQLQGRTITHSQELKLIELLKPFSETNFPILITFMPEAPESRTYAERIAEVLKKCGFNTECKPSIEYDTPNDPFPTGLRFEEWGTQSSTLSEDILVAFKTTGISAQSKIVKLNADQKGLWFIRVWLKPEK